MVANTSGLEQAGELKMGQVGIANLRVRSFDIPKLAEEMRERVERAPKLFSRAAVVVDFGELAKTPDTASAQSLLDALKATGVLPVALAYGTSAIERLSQELGLPLLAKFRAQYESATAQATTPAPEPAPQPPSSEPGTMLPSMGDAASLLHTAPVRSGQQVYAQGRDLTVVAVVGAGAEVIADGSVHIYGALRGRALAGAQGNEKARIFCREFHAELVAIAGRYKVIEEVPKELRGKPVQVWLEQDTLRMAAIA